MNFEDDVNRRVQESLERISRIPIAVLIWGPDVQSGSPIAHTRQQLKDELQADGHVARFSEELFNPSSPHSLVAQQFAHAEAYDVVFSLPGSPGSIAEIHDFARMPGVGNKIVAFVNQDWSDGYASKALMQMESTLTSRIQVYAPGDLPHRVVSIAKNHVHRLQELFYCFLGRRC